MLVRGIHRAKGNIEISLSDQDAQHPKIMWLKSIIDQIQEHPTNVLRNDRNLGQIGIKMGFQRSIEIAVLRPQTMVGQA